MVGVPTLQGTLMGSSVNPQGQARNHSESRLSKVKGKIMRIQTTLWGGIAAANHGKGLWGAVKWWAEQMQVLRLP
jgi:hypothetical protein